MKPLYIAELGINHHGNLSKAFRMIDLAKDAGAHIAKFQFYSPIDVLGETHPDLDYAVQCQFTTREHEKLKKHCDDIGIEYMVSVFDIKDIPFANDLCKRMKVASRMNRNLEFLAYIDRCKKYTIMSLQEDVQLRSTYRDRFYFMWCVRNYPSTFTETVDHNFSYKYGLSSHCPDPLATVHAFKEGARIFENHVCESRKEDGCDISSSLTFAEYKDMIDEITSLETVRR